MLGRIFAVIAVIGTRAQVAVAHLAEQVHISLQPAWCLDMAYYMSITQLNGGDDRVIYLQNCQF
jgi:hypothetical protein